MDVDRFVQYIDGTKIESNANRYSFVYKKRILNTRMKFLIVCQGYNLRKYHKYRLKREKEEREKLLLN